MRHSIESDPSRRVLLQLFAEVACLSLEQAETVKCRTEGIRLLHDQLPTFVKALKST